MIDKNLHTFIDGAVNFFNHTGTDVAAKVGSPYLIDSVSQINSDYTGCITVSGAYPVSYTHLTLPTTPYV